MAAWRAWTVHRARPTQGAPGLTPTHSRSPTTPSTGSAPGSGRATGPAPTNQYPAGAAFGGYKISGIGRENHRMMLDHYSETKNLLVSYSSKPLGLF